MRSRHMAGIGIAVAWGLAGAATGAWAQGSLTPPGAPAPAMRTLTQVEPRTAITNLPFTISQPGSYYLTANLTSTVNGIIIQSSRVTVDLMGFSITGDRSSSLDYGIWLLGASNAAVRDVVVAGGIVCGFGRGMKVDYAQNCRAEGLTVSSNTSSGIDLYGQYGSCNGNIVRGCDISGNGNFGVSLFGQAGECDGNTVANCTISGNADHGILVSGTTGGGSRGNVISACTISRNSGCGIMLTGSGGVCDGNTVANCTISRNGGSGGIYLDGSNSGSCDGNTVTHCVLNRNLDYGIYCNSTWGNRIEDNHVHGTTSTNAAVTYGIYSASSSTNFIFRNTCMGQTNNYQFSAGDTYGPIVTNSGALSTNGVSAHPWANFSR